MTQPLLFAPTDLRPLLSAEDWSVLRERALACSKCRLRATAGQVVFGDGKTDRPDIFIVGEGPGANEDREGKPFVGAAGQLLDKMLTAIGYDRSQVYIANVVNCRPPSNRVPAPDEVTACNEWLLAQIRAVQPKVLLALGATAARLLTKSKPAVNLGDLRTRWFTFEGVPLRVSFHPAYLLRNPIEKPTAWMDLKVVVERAKQP